MVVADDLTLKVTLIGDYLVEVNLKNLVDTKIERFTCLSGKMFPLKTDQTNFCLDDSKIYEGLMKCTTLAQALSKTYKIVFSSNTAEELFDKIKLFCKQTFVIKY